MGKFPAKPANGDGQKLSECVQTTARALGQTEADFREKLRTQLHTVFVDDSDVSYFEGACLPVHSTMAAAIDGFDNIRRGGPLSATERLQSVKQEDRSPSNYLGEFIKATEGIGGSRRVTAFIQNVTPNGLLWCNFHSGPAGDPKTWTECIMRAAEVDATHQRMLKAGGNMAGFGSGIGRGVCLIKTDTQKDGAPEGPNAGADITPPGTPQVKPTDTDEDDGPFCVHVFPEAPTTKLTRLAVNQAQTPSTIGQFSTTQCSSEFYLGCCQRNGKGCKAPDHLKPGEKPESK